MVSHCGLKTEFVRIVVITQCSFFLVNLQFSSAFNAFTFNYAANESEFGRSKRENVKVSVGSVCSVDEDCPFENAICDRERRKCQCDSQFPAFDGISKCAKAVTLYASCSFDEQCEYDVWNSMCREGKCVCRGNGKETSMPDGSTKCVGRQFGDACSIDEECGFKLAVCDPYKQNCQCPRHLTATNHIDKCGEAKKVNEECFFNEQCEQTLFDTICLDGICQCRSERTPVINTDGSIKCIVIEEKSSDVGADPTMIIVLSVMCLMFIIICVVLHLFSKARWRENRTIFNTPNPRLMNVSLIREKKNERRGSKDGSAKGPPSREPSMASLRQHSPSAESKCAISRRESRGANSNGSARSPTTRGPPPAIYAESTFSNN